MSRAVGGGQSRRVRMGIIGCGSFARMYHLPTLLADPRVELTMICDPFAGGETRQLAREVGATLTAEMEHLWEGGVCDAVLVSSPHALHVEQVWEAVRHGRHVLVDKPFVLRSLEVKELAQAAAARGLVGAVAFNRRFDPGCRRTRELILSGRVGAIRYVETLQLGYPSHGWIRDPRLGGGGPFVGRGTHMADLVPWLLDMCPDRVRSRVLLGEPGRVDNGGFMEVEFQGLACHMTCLAQGLYMWDEVRVFGEGGMIEMKRPLDRPLGWEMTHWGPRGERLETVPSDEARGRATANFLDALEGKAAVACSFADAWLSVRLIEAAYESAESAGHWIDL